VLLVDDSVEHRDLYALMLESTAMVLTASRGEEALAIAGAEPLDVIVLDLLMPGMDGWEVRERLKADPTTRSIPVILLTSLEKEDVAERAREAGMAAVLTKPCPVERLAVAIRDALPEPALVGDLAPVSVGVVPQRVPGTRRWARKRVPTSILASVERRQAHLLNISYGGMCLAFDYPHIDIPQAFAVTVREDVTVRAEAVWMNRDAQRMWVCGAELCSASEEWRRFVDAIG
jgi:CheY-like chemotaxis protein